MHKTFSVLLLNKVYECQELMVHIYHKCNILKNSYEVAYDLVIITLKKEIQ